jgi:hypothetical protein
MRMTAITVADRPQPAVAPAGSGHQPAVKSTLGGPFSRRIGVWVALLGILATIVAAKAATARPGVYFSEVKVIFLAPNNALYPNSLIAVNQSVIMTAGLVGVMSDPGKSQNTKVTDPNISIVNQGIRDGYRIQLPNDGGQWSDNYDQSLLDVQAVGPTLAGVVSRMQSLIARINATLTKIQDDRQVAAVNRIRTSVNPAQVPIYYQTGSKIRVLAAVVILGLGLTVAAQIWARRFVRRRRSTKQLD